MSNLQKCMEICARKKLCVDFQFFCTNINFPRNFLKNPSLFLSLSPCVYKIIENTKQPIVKESLSVVLAQAQLGGSEREGRLARGPTKCLELIVLSILSVMLVPCVHTCAETVEECTLNPCSLWYVNYTKTNGNLLFSSFVFL